ncbi:hypothetical protein LJC74_01120 [Eubacteriales bacterium OttesenSCG-928-A19]|nr:hypothetical protein [Eubacteriales bacterium OttesenSCG-928-A19]
MTHAEAVEWLQCLKKALAPQHDPDSRIDSSTLKALDMGIDALIYRDRQHKTFAYLASVMEIKKAIDLEAEADKIIKGIVETQFPKDSEG